MGRKKVGRRVVCTNGAKRTKVKGKIVCKGGK